MQRSSALPPPRGSSGLDHAPERVISSEDRYAPSFGNDRSRGHGPIRDNSSFPGGRYSSSSSSRYHARGRGEDTGCPAAAAAVTATAAAAAALALPSEPIIEKMVPKTPQPSRHVAEAQQALQEKRGQDQVRIATSSLPTTAASPPPAPVDAALVARQGAIKSGYLWKMGANVPRWKRRFFVLKPITMLFYYMSEHDTEPRGCIDLDLFDAVRKVREDCGDGASSDRGTGMSMGMGPSSNKAAGPSAPTEASASTSSSSSSKRRRSSPAGAGAGPESTLTTFELYRSGCPDGSGFMLEARGGEDWEEWVESIANGRHGKMRAEMDVMKGANKLLLEEISGLEQQVATFRGYADQRHVTVLALRDERHRNREVAAELAALGDTASALSHLISESVKSEQQQTMQQGGDASVVDIREGADRVQQQQQLVGASAEAAGTSWPSRTGSGGVGDDGFDLLSAQAPAPAPASRDDNEDDDRHQRQQRVEERASFEAVRRALAEARAELGRKGRALLRETERRQAVERRLARAEGLASAAVERATSAEAATARASGRVSVLERNVEYLRTQQAALRAELRQARHKTQVLKRGVRDMWSRHTSSTSSAAAPSGSSLPFPLSSSRGPLHGGPDSANHHQQRHQAQRQKHGGGGGGGSCSRHRARTWASMGDLAEADVRSCSAANGEEGAGEGVGEERESRNIRLRQQRGSLRSRLSGESLAPASDGGETDFADRTNSEASDQEDGDTRFPGHFSAQEAWTGSISNPFREGVCRTIRKRAGPLQVPPLPPPRHSRTLMAVNHLCSVNKNNSNAKVAAATRQQQQSQQQSDGIFGSGNGNDNSGGGNGNTAFGVAGMLLGLRVGMVDKAAQEMGKKLALWPGAAGMGKMPSVSSLGSLAVGAIGGGGKSGSGFNAAAANGLGGGDGGGVRHLQTPVGSPRSSSTSVSAALTDSPVRWDNASSSHGSTASTNPGFTDTATAAEMGDACATTPATRPHAGAFSAGYVGEGVAADASAPSVTGTGAVVLSTGTGSGAAASASAGVVPGANGNGLHRVGSVSSRMPLIQLSDLELAEPCGRRIGGGGGGGDGGLGGGIRGVNAGSSGNSSSRRASTGRRSSSPPLPPSTTSARRRLSSLLPPRPDDEYELLFTSRVIGLQFKGLVDGSGVFVAGSNGYVGPAPTTGVPGERLCPDAGDILESYNGVSARGKSAEVVAAELAQCGRPLRLGFRSARADFLAEEAEQELEEDEDTLAAATYNDGGGGPCGGAARESGAGKGKGASSCREDVAFAAPSNPWAVSS